MADISKLDNLSIDDLASFWGVDKVDIAKVMGLDVSVITGDLSAGSPEIFGPGITRYTSVTAMDTTHAIVTYEEYTGSFKGKAICLTLSGTSITAGSPTAFSGGYTKHTSVTTLDSTHAIVTYQDGDVSGLGRARCLTLSGTTITAGSVETFESDISDDTSVTAMDSTHAIVTYIDNADGDKGKAVCLTLSGTSITAGSVETFESGNIRYLSVTAMDATHAIVTYQDNPNNDKGKAVCLTLSGTSITTGPKETLPGVKGRYTSVTTMDSTHAIVTYQNWNGFTPTKARAVCLTLSGTTITAASGTRFSSVAAYNLNPSVTAMDATHAIVTYRANDGDKGKAVCLTLSGTSITAGSPTTFESGNTNYTSVTTLDSTHAIVTYQDGDDGNKGKAVCITLS